MSVRYQQSEQLLERACQSIPLGSQTFSKSKAALPYGVSPFFAERAEGCRLWDVDGHDYIDFINALLSVSLGYRDPDVDRAVQAQLASGVTFSLPHRLETMVAEQLIEMIPSAEQVRFGKNGTDVTSAAVRIARAYTGKEHIAVCGYHGWQDWYIGSTSRDLGVPEAVKSLTHTFTYNSIDSLEALFQAYPHQIAAVVMEPITFDEAAPGFLEAVKALCEAEGALLVFDEMITGFRLSLGGAQALLGVTPHLSTFGKGMANGFPISALVGSRDIMAKMDDIFFSGTFGGETLSLAAAHATLNKMVEYAVPTYLAQLGERLMKGVEAIIEEHQLSDMVTLKGRPAWTLLNFKPYREYDLWALKSYFMQACFLNGVLIQSTHNLSYAHQASHIDRLITLYQAVLPKLKQLCDDNGLQQAIKGEVIKPVFTVRST